MKTKHYVVKTMNVEEEVLVVNTLNETEGVCDLHASKGICCHSFIHFDITKKAWKEVKSKLGLRVTSTFAAFNEEED